MSSGRRETRKEGRMKRRELERERENENTKNMIIHPRHWEVYEQYHGCIGVQNILDQTNSQTYTLHTFVERVILENQDGGIGRHTAPPRTTRTDRKSNGKGVRHQGNTK